MSREIELKLELTPDAAERLLKQPWLEHVERRSEAQQSIYFDNADARLRKRGYMLRVRSAGGAFIQTVKSLNGGAGLFDRGEWEWELGGPEPDPAKLRETPARGPGLDHLRPWMRLETERTSCRLKSADTQIALDFDRGTMSADGREARICELELELLCGTPEDVLNLACRIADEVPVKLGVMSKAERGFALADGASSDVSKAESVPLTEKMTVADGFEAIVLACLRHLRLNEPLLIERRAPEALHQVRVALRRLRAALSLFRSAVADQEHADIRDGLRWFAGELGEARNIDVYLERELPDDERAFLRQRREVAYDLVTAALDSQRFRRLMLDLVGWSKFGEWRGKHKAGKPLQPYVDRRIDRVWRKIEGMDPLHSMDERQRHRSRIEVKKLRYALEFVAALHKRQRHRRKDFSRTVQDLQEALGQMNDAAVARTLAAADPWPVAPHGPGEEEDVLLKEAGRALRRLRKIGRYWAAPEG